jgi:hypothetical protein
MAAATENQLSAKWRKRRISWRQLSAATCVSGESGIISVAAAAWLMKINENGKQLINKRHGEVMASGSEMAAGIGGEMWRQRRRNSGKSMA